MAIYISWSSVISQGMPPKKKQRVATSGEKGEKQPAEVADGGDLLFYLNGQKMHLKSGDPRCNTTSSLLLPHGSISSCTQAQA